MELFNGVKFVSDDDREFIILKQKCVNNNYYGLAVNLNDEKDMMIVKIAKDEEGYFFEVVVDLETINNIKIN